MCMYQVAMATRLKRKVFRAGNIREDVERLSKSAAAVSGCEITEISFRPYGMEFLLDCADMDAAEEAVRSIRYSTSGTLRKRYPELWSMPSFWTRKTLIIETDGTVRPEREIEEYYASLRSR